MTLNPLRNGKTFGVLDGTIIKCGDKVAEGGCNAGTGEVFIAQRDRRRSRLPLTAADTR